MKIKPIIEYAQLDCVARDRSDNRDIFEQFDEDEQPYWGAVISRLKASYGLYVFYDSLTRPLYVGIARKQHIWARANQSYNKWRDRNGKIMVVGHPSSKVSYSQEKVRPVRRKGFTLADVAEYFSAYQIEGNETERNEIIAGLEAFAIRAFGGVLLNTKMEGNGGFGLAPVDAEES